MAVGRADVEIMKKAEEIRASLIVMGGGGVGAMRRALASSIYDSVVRHARCSVMVGRGDALTFPTKVLLATGGSEEANLTALTTIELAENTDSQLPVAYAEPVSYTYEFAAWEGFDPDLPISINAAARDGASRNLEEQVQRIREAGSDFAEAYARVGHPDTEIVALAGKLGARLIVMASRALGSLKSALVGSVFDAVVHHSLSSVLVVRR